jgi:Na+-transporting methylmalonyl-CoA/oxaloacetate decarboxylase beta subunit
MLTHLLDMPFYLKKFQSNRIKKAISIMKEKRNRFDSLSICGKVSKVFFPEILQYAVLILMFNNSQPIAIGLMILWFFLAKYTVLKFSTTNDRLEEEEDYLSV